MTDAPVCLTLIVPRKLRDELFDHLSEQTDLVSGFTASDAAGHGAKVRLHTAAERWRATPTPLYALLRPTFHSPAGRSAGPP